MDVSVVPLTSFIHGAVDAHEGRPMLLDEATARELVEAHLVRYWHLAPTLEATGGHDSGKVTDDGMGSPSSALPVAPVSPTKTLPPSERGATLTLRKGK